MRKAGTYAVVVVVVVPSLCQPLGEAAGFCGSVRFSKPSGIVSLVMGRTRYCDRPQSAVAAPHYQRRGSAYRSLRDEIGELDDLARVRVNERLEPRARLLVLDLHDVSERERAVLLGDKLERRWVLVEFAGERALGLSDRILEGQRGGGAGDECCRVREDRCGASREHSRTHMASRRRSRTTRPCWPC